MKWKSKKNGEILTHAFEGIPRRVCHRYYLYACQSILCVSFPLCKITWLDLAQARQTPFATIEHNV